MFFRRNQFGLIHLIPLLLLVILLIGIVTSIKLVNYEQDVRSKAAEATTALEDFGIVDTNGNGYIGVTITGR